MIKSKTNTVSVIISTVHRKSPTLGFINDSTNGETTDWQIMTTNTITIHSLYYHDSVLTRYHQDCISFKSVNCFLTNSSSLISSSSSLGLISVSLIFFLISFSLFFSCWIIALKSTITASSLPYSSKLSYSFINVLLTYDKRNIFIHSSFLYCW